MPKNNKNQNPTYFRSFTPNLKRQNAADFSPEECRTIINNLNSEESRAIINQVFNTVVRPVVENRLQNEIGDLQLIPNPRNVITNLLPQINLIQLLQQPGIEMPFMQQPGIDMLFMQQQLAVTNQQELADGIINIADLPEVQLNRPLTRNEFVDLFMQGLTNLFVAFMQNMQTQSRKRDREEENQDQAEKFQRIEVLEDDAEIPAVTPDLTPNRIPVGLLVATGSRTPARSHVEPSYSSGHNFGGPSSSNSNNNPLANSPAAPNANNHNPLGEGLLPQQFNPPVQPNNMGLGVPALLSTVVVGGLSLIAKKWFTGNQEGFDEIDNSEITPKRLNQLASLANTQQNAEQLDRIARHQNCQMQCSRFILNSEYASAETKEYIKNSGKNQSPMKKGKIKI